MALAAAAGAGARFITSASRSPLTLVLSKYPLFLGFSYSPIGLGSSPLAGAIHLRPSLSCPAVRLAAPGTARLNLVRCRVYHSGDSSSLYWNLKAKSLMNLTLRQMGRDYEHWLVVMNKPGGEGATKHQMIDCYIQTLAMVVGSEEEAKKRIYSVSCDCERYLGFGCEIDEETASYLEGHGSICHVLPDSYVDHEYEDYGGELFVNGEIVQRPLERQRRVQTGAIKYRFNWTWHMRRRLSQRQGW